MKNNPIKEFFFSSTNKIKILKTLIINPDQVLRESEIAKTTGTSIGSTNQILKELAKEHFIIKTEIGTIQKIKLYQINIENVFIKEYKILINMLLISDIIDELKEHCSKIILFGSCATGTDLKESDIDLYILSHYKDKVSKIIEKYSYSSSIYNKKIQAIIENPLKQTKDTVFLDQVERGKVLWEK